MCKGVVSRGQRMWTKGQDRQWTDGQTCSSSIRLCNTSRLLLLNWWKPWEGMAWVNVRTGWDKKKGGNKQKGGKNGQNSEVAMRRSSICYTALTQFNEKNHQQQTFREVQIPDNSTPERNDGFNRSVLLWLFRLWNRRSYLTCGGICPPFFSQVSFGVGDPDARQYNLTVSPSWASTFEGLTWTWGWVPRPLGLDSDEKCIVPII